MTPLRRARRVLRWVAICGPIPRCSSVHSTDRRVKQKDDGAYERRCDLADDLFAGELEFVVKLAVIAARGTEDMDPVKLHNDTSKDLRFWDPLPLLNVVAQ